MTLSTHILAGTVVASAFPASPAVGFGLAFVSHFLLDAIPHWDYKFFARVKDTSNPMNDDVAFDGRFLRDLARISLDIAIGSLLALLWYFYFERGHFIVVLAGIAGGVLPDALQVVYAKFRHEPLASLQRFHMWIQRGRELKVVPFVGILLQCLVILAIFGLYYFIKS